MISQRNIKCFTLIGQEGWPICGRSGGPEEGGEGRPMLYEAYQAHDDFAGPIRALADLAAGSLVLQLYFSASLSIVRLLGFSLMVTSPD